MDNIQSFWKLNDGLRRQSKVVEDNKWFLAASKLAEQTTTKGEGVKNLDLSKGPIEPRKMDLTDFLDDFRAEDISLSFLNLNSKLCDTMGKGSFWHEQNIMNSDDQKGQRNTFGSIVANKYNSNSVMSRKLSNINCNNNGNLNNDNSGSVEKRFKTLPISETLPRNEVLGGYIFVCNNDTMQEDLRRKLFGLPPRYRDSVRAITPGLPLFLYNYTTHQLHGIFEAASFGGSNIDPTAWEDKKCKGESRFPAQVRVCVRKICKPLEEDAFRPVLYHYDGPKFRLELSVPETLAVLDLCEQAGA